MGKGLDEKLGGKEKVYTARNNYYRDSEFF